MFMIIEWHTTSICCKEKQIMLCVQFIHGFIILFYIGLYKVENLLVCIRNITVWKSTPSTVVSLKGIETVLHFIVLNV